MTKNLRDVINIKIILHEFSGKRMPELMPSKMKGDAFSDSINHQSHVSLLQSISTTGSKDKTIITKVPLSLLDITVQ